MRALLALLLAWVATLAIPAPARAQDATPIAEQLFRDGRALMERGKTDEACEKFSSSQSLSPALGTLLNLALCREAQGRSATAWSLFAEVESLAQRAGDAMRARIANDHGAALSPQLKKVVIEVPQPLPGMSIKLDGTALPAGALGTEIPLDPGDHDVLVTAPGKKPWAQSKLNLGPSATTVHLRVELEDEAKESGLPAPPASSWSATEPPPSDPGRTKRILGLAAGSAGIVLLGVAVGETVTSVGRANDESKYPAGSANRQTVADQSSLARTYAIVSGAAGIAALGAGIVLFVTASGAARSQGTVPASRLGVSPVIAAGFGGLQMVGSW
jgi:hypothetical protein